VPTPVIGAYYRLSGLYNTFENNAANIQFLPIVSNTAQNQYHNEDGRSLEDGTSPYSLVAENTGGAWKRYIFDFRAAFTTTRVFLRLRNAGANAAETGFVWLDDWSLRRVWRFNTYETRIKSKGIPAIATGSTDIYFGGKSIGLGVVELHNDDRGLDDLSSALEWLNHEARITELGQFSDTNEILFDDALPQFAGLVQSYRTNDKSVSLELQDIRVFFHVMLPPSVHEDLATERDFIGRPEPLFFGAKENIRPVRTTILGSGYGRYKLAYTGHIGNVGIFSVDRVLAYADNEAAQIRDESRALVLTLGTHYTAGLLQGRINIEVDVGPYEVTAENNKLNFDIGGVELTATLALGLYTAAGLASEATTKMTAAAATAVSLAYSETTHLWTFSKSSGTLNLRTQNGTDKDISAWSLIGFHKGGNRTGALSYVGDDPTFTHPDDNHIIRCDAKGYKDTATGRYTGTPSALIDKGADICQFLVEVFLKKPYSIIDQASFVDARTRAPESLAFYLNERESTKSIFDKLEYSNVANIVVDGAGFIYYNVYSGAVPESTPSILDHDFLEFSVERSVTDVYRAVVVKYDQDPTTGRWEEVQAADESVSVRFGRVEQRVFETYHKITDTAQLLANRLLTLAQRPPRKITLAVKSKLLRSEVGGKVRLYRDRASDPNGALTGQAFRIVSIRKLAEEARIEADVVDDVTTVAGIACLTSCQDLCQNLTQGCGSSVCESTCEANPCQEGCQATAQDCTVMCQTLCEATCQGCAQGVPVQGPGPCGTTCETSCQSCGQGIGCQGVCQNTCQDCGQAGQCESACETSCQSCGQAGHCQETCEASPCQEGCQVSCQNDCQLGVCQHVREEPF
jgi:hypothetical protein